MIEWQKHFIVVYPIVFRANVKNVYKIECKF